MTDNDRLNFSLARSTVLITGGSGSWGQELTRQLLKDFDPKEIRIYSRGEEKQVQMKRRFQEPKLRFIIGDVRDPERLKEASRNVDCIFHLAALKHVPVVEENPWEAVQTNIVGTQNVITAAIENKVKKIIDVSSDKACNPLSLYGITKAVGEKLIIAANNLSGDSSFVCIRAGNVLGTSGSVIPLFREQISRANEITITDKRMSRFFMRLKDAIGLVLKSAVSSVGGEMFVTKMPALKIASLASVMIKRLGNKKTTMKHIGLRPGEKMYEWLVSENEATRCFELGNYYLIFPMISIPKLEAMHKYKYQKLKPVKFKEYTSDNTEQLNHSEIENLLEKDGWLKTNERLEALKYLETLEKSQLKNFAKTEGWAAKR